MKNKTLLLFKNNIINTYKLKSTSNKKKIIIIALIIYIISCLGISLGLFLNNMLKILTKLHMFKYYIVILFSIASMFAFIFSIFSTKSGLFDNRDNNLLFSLPVTKKEILTSRLLMILLYNFFIGLIFIVPGLIIYFNKVSSCFIDIVSVILLVIFFPIIPTILSCIIGYLIALLTSKTNAKSLFELIYYTLFIILYLIIINNANKILMALLKDTKLFNILLKTLFLPIYLIFKGIDSGNFIFILCFILINIIILFLFINVLNKSYLNIISKLNSQKTKSNFKMKNMKSKTVKKTLFEKELKRYFSSAIYVFNTIFGVVLILIAAIASFIYSPDKILSVVNIGINLNAFSLVFFLLLLTISLTITTNSSISMERENLWIIKMLPVKVKDIFNSKLLLNRIILIPICFVSLILFKVSGFITIGEMLLLFVLTIIYGFFISNFGLISNLLFPNLSAINDTVIVKQSIASLVGVLGGLFFFIIMLLITLKNNFSNTLSIIVSILISLILYIISEFILRIWGVQKFKEIN